TPPMGQRALPRRAGPRPSGGPGRPYPLPRRARLAGLVQDSSVSSGQAPAAPEPLTVGRLLLRGITMRCPVCGGRGLFRRWVHMVRHCPRCGFDLERIEGHWIGALGMNTIVTFGAVLVAVVIGFTVT